MTNNHTPVGIAGACYFTNMYSIVWVIFSLETELRANVHADCELILQETNVWQTGTREGRVRADPKLKRYRNGPARGCRNTIAATGGGGSGGGGDTAARCVSTTRVRRDARAHYRVGRLSVAGSSEGGCPVSVVHGQ